MVNRGSEAHDLVDLLWSMIYDVLLWSVDMICDLVWLIVLVIDYSALFIPVDARTRG